MPQTAETRSRIMRAVKGRDTRPEMIVRRLLHSLGYRYRLHRGDLPGKPDIAFPARRKVVFVHGCFWHGHACARGARSPKTNTSYWSRKITSNVARDRENFKKLKNIGWSSLILWECELTDRNDVEVTLRRFLDPSPLTDVTCELLARASGNA
jgi:DNA mismatch endonuclease (patch repair protein)